MLSPARLVLLVVAAASLTLLGSVALKNECTYHDWGDWYQYNHYCYSDILPLYYIRNLDDDHRPYLDEFSEYPVLTGFVTYLAAVVTDTMHGYMVITFFLLLGGYAATIALYRLHLSPWQLMGWAASPAIVIHGTTNWDLIAVGLAAWGWLAWREGKPFYSSLLFGLGGAAKLYPAFFLPLLFVDVVRRRDPKGIAHSLLGGTLGFGVPNLVVFLLAPKNWLEIWRFHMRRDPDFETPWQAALGGWGRDMGPEAYRELVGNLGLLAMVVGLLGLAWLVWRRRLDALDAGGLLVLVFLLTNRVYSPQYTLWALPLLPLMTRARIVLWLYVLADLGVFLVRYKLFTPPPGATEGWNPEWDAWHKLAVNVRWLFLAILAAEASRRAFRKPNGDPAEASAGREPVEGKDPGAGPSVRLHS